MTSDTKISGSDATMHKTAHTGKTKRRTPLLLMLVGGLCAFAGTIAPKAVSRLARKMVFSPARIKSQELAHNILAKARIEQLKVGTENVFHYIWGDSGLRILLVHGWAGDASHMTAFVEPLMQAGYQVVALDLPAHGKSSGNESSIAHFERSIAHAATAFGPFHGVIAHSMGAAAVTYALSRGLQSERVVFLGPVSKFESMWRQLQRTTNFPPKVIRLMISQAETWLGISFDEIDPTHLAPSMTAPLLVVHDRGDRECPFEDGEMLVAKWPNAKMLATEKMGHMRGLRDQDVVQQVIAFFPTQPTS